MIVLQTINLEWRLLCVADYELLKEAFQSAEEHDVLLHEITTIIQRKLSMMREIFGELKEGTFEEPAITKESVHHFFKDVADGKLNVYSNGEFTYQLKGKYAKVSVVWNLQAPEGAGDTHYSIMHCTLSDIYIKQDKEENYIPEVFIQLTSGENVGTFEAALKKAVESTIAPDYPGLKLVKLENGLWAVDIPEKYKVGHEAHFEQVTQKYLRYLTNGDMPDWEVPCMLTKYYTTTQAYELSKK